MRLSPRLSILVGIFILGFVISGGWAYRTLSTLQVNGPVYQRIVQGKDLIADVLPPPAYIIESYLVALQLLDIKDEGGRTALIGRLRTLKDEYDARHRFWEKEQLDADSARLLLKDAYEPAAVFYRVAMEQYVPALQGGNGGAAARPCSRWRRPTRSTGVRSTSWCR